ncbi:hypothetical protein ABZX88_32460 [Kitasatospora aureofaciens]|uniref:hypothetical protein n=1 Tax=Kitasatospora aureofaciens TaxID=1894 RepID=UPI0033B291B7
MASKPPTDFDAIADALYVLAPAAFTAARNERADEVKKSDPQLAKAIRALYRPTVAAWAANLLAHRHHDLVGQLMDLGQALREAQEHLAGEQLRGLADQRRQLVRALIEQARRDAAAAGHPLASDAVADLDRTLSAALADPDAARALAEGRLTAALEPPLWPGAAPSRTEAGQPDVSTDVGAGPDTGTPPARRRPAAERASHRASATDAPPGDRQNAAAPDRAREWERKREKARIAAAETAEREAADRAAEAERELRSARASRQRAQDEADRAEAALVQARERDDRARDALARANARVRQTETASDFARGRVARAREAVREAAERLRRLEND